MGREEFRKLAERPIVRYVLIGGISYLIEVGCIALLVYGFSFSDTYAVGISFWIGLLCSFFLQKLFTFSKSTHSKKTRHQFLLYIILVAVNYGFTLWFVYVFSGFMGLIVARTLALIVTTIWNFFLYKKLIFA